MADAIHFRVRLSALDWDQGTRAYRCSVLGLPGVYVKTIYVGGAEVPPSDFVTDVHAREIRFRAAGVPPAEILVAIEVGSALTTRRTAGISSAASAIVVAAITAFAQYMSAVAPARAAKERAEQSAARACPRATANTKSQTLGDYAPIVHGSGTVTIHQGKP